MYADFFAQTTSSAIGKSQTAAGLSSARAKWLRGLRVFCRGTGGTMRNGRGANST
jgi:hypothetical protein